MAVGDVPCIAQSTVHELDVVLIIGQDCNRYAFLLVQMTFLDLCPSQRRCIDILLEEMSLTKTPRLVPADLARILHEATP